MTLALPKERRYPVWTPAGKVAVVTGAGKGIGMATTLALADEGAHVVAGSRTTGTLDGLKGVTPWRST